MEEIRTQEVITVAKSHDEDAEVWSCSEEGSSTMSDSSYDESSDESSSSSSLDDVTPGEKSAGLFLSLEMVQLLRTSTSEGNLFNAMLPKATVNKMTPDRRNSGGAPSASRMVFALQTKSTMESHPQHAASDAKIPKPKDTLKNILEEQGLEVKYRKYSDLPDFFVKCCVNSHSYDLMTAVRQNDMSVIRKLYETGHNLQCSNRFQESIVHAVARRGLPDILTYLMQVAGVSVRVCCDGGRNALHDACWTGNPSWECIRMLLQECPDLLFITDKRNFSPLDYIPKDANEDWNAWLNENKDLLIPREIL
jgi:Ankyrin repeats (3 copies)